MQSQRTSHWPMVAILALAFLARLGAAVWWEGRLAEGERFGFPDSDSYWVLGQAIAAGDTYAYGDMLAFRTPGYPLLLAAVMKLGVVGAAPFAARVAGASLGTFAVGGIAWLAGRLFDRRAALLAAIAAALLPDMIAMSVFILSEALFVPLMVAQAMAWTLAAETKSGRRAMVFSVVTGVLAGAATLTRPSWLLFTPLALVLFAFYQSAKGGTWRTSVSCFALPLLLGFFVTMMPWWVRNSLVFGEFVATTTQGGATLFDGLHPGATGASEMSFVPVVRKIVEHKRAAGELPASVPLELALDRFFTAQAWKFAAENPGETWRLAAVKFARTWNPFPNEAMFQSWPMRVVTAIGYLPVLLLGLWGTCKFAGRGWPYLLCALPLFYTALLHTVFVGSIRYRQPAMVLLLVLAAGVVTNYRHLPKFEKF